MQTYLFKARVAGGGIKSPTPAGLPIWGIILDTLYSAPSALPGWTHTQGVALGYYISRLWR
jgi:hypothetical protein